jgi:hypothetical protein
MGTDVYGRNPTGVHGKHFHASGWEWQLLVRGCQQVAPELVSVDWHTKGLDAAGSLSLAEALTKEIEAKRTGVYLRDFVCEMEHEPWLRADRSWTECVAAFATFLHESGGFNPLAPYPRADRPSSNTEVTMRETMTDEFKKKIEKDELCAEVRNFAHRLMRGGRPPLDVVEALINGTIAFAGRIGEDAMRHYVTECDELDYISRRAREKAAKRDDIVGTPS